MRVIRVGRPAFMADAACRGGDPAVMALFFPGIGVGAGRAKRFCDSCPVVADCRTYALERPELAGIWGGLTENDRDQIRARR